MLLTMLFSIMLVITTHCFCSSDGPASLPSYNTYNGRQFAHEEHPLLEACWRNTTKLKSPQRVCVMQNYMAQETVSFTLLSSLDIYAVKVQCLLFASYFFRILNFELLCNLYFLSLLPFIVWLLLLVIRESQCFFLWYPNTITVVVWARQLQVCTGCKWKNLIICEHIF